MPLYPFVCPKCEAEQLELRSVVKMDAPLACSKCGAGMTRTLTTPAKFNIQGGGTRNHNKIKMVPLRERMAAKYGDNP